MSLKRKLSTVYFVITVLFFLIFSGYLVFINSNKLKEESYEKLTSYTESIKQQYQLQLASYDQAVTNLLSDKEFLLDLRTLSDDIGQSGILGHHVGIFIAHID